MNRSEALHLLKSGTYGISEWNRWRETTTERLPDLSNADLPEADLRNANLSKADVRWSRFRRANLNGVDLTDAKLIGANLIAANLFDAHIYGANLSEADLSGANLGRADLRRARLQLTNLCNAHLSEANLDEAVSIGTLWADVDLTQVEGLDGIFHEGPSTLGTDTIVKSRGRISEPFLRGCGLSPWEILSVRLHDSSLSAQQITDLQYSIFDQRTKGPMFIGGFFISYSHTDASFADKLQGQLLTAGASVWRDKHDLVAGPLERQLFDGLRMQDVVVLVLSEASVQSDWVEAELEEALVREKKESRSILLPIALDEAWKTKVKQAGSVVLWRQITKKNILNFSQWKTKAFAGSFDKLVTGVKRYYVLDKPTA